MKCNLKTFSKNCSSLIPLPFKLSDKLVIKLDNTKQEQRKKKVIGAKHVHMQRYTQITTKEQ
jgi:hypothetical protein